MAVKALMCLDSSQFQAVSPIFDGYRDCILYKLRLMVRERAQASVPPGSVM